MLRVVSRRNSENLTVRKFNQSISKEINLEYSLKWSRCWKLRQNTHDEDKSHRKRIILMPGKDWRQEEKRALQMMGENQSMDMSLLSLWEAVIREVWGVAVHSRVDIVQQLNTIHSPYSLMLCSSISSATHTFLLYSPIFA